MTWREAAKGRSLPRPRRFVVESVVMSGGGELQRVTSERDLAIERFVLMCKAMNQCMWDWDMRANVAWYSDAIYTVFGIDPTVTPGFDRWTTYVHPDDRERVVAGFRNVVESGKSEWADEYRFVRPNDGIVLEVFDRGFVMVEEGHPVRIVGVVMDITQQRALAGTATITVFGYEEDDRFGTVVQRSSTLEIQ